MTEKKNKRTKNIADKLKIMIGEYINTNKTVSFQILLSL